jgi:hypothetical protein
VADSTPAPTQQDIQNATNRAAIAQKQNEEWGRVYAWAFGAFGPGYEPVGRHYLVDKVEEEAARKEDRPVVAAMTAYCVNNGTGRRRYFTMDEGQVTEHLGYQEAFGPALTEPHPTLRFMHRGKELPAHHYSLCWGSIERYEPMTAEQLSILRASRERQKAEREEAAFQRDNPLLAWAERVRAEEDGGRGR